MTITTTVNNLRGILIAFVMACLLSLSIPSLAIAAPDNIKAQEYGVKAAFLYNFSKFIDWPSSVIEKDNYFVICIVGNNPFNEETLASIGAKQTKNKDIRIKHVNSSKHITGCHIAFISNPETLLGKKVIDASRNQHVLTISDHKNFTSHGGMIELFTVNQKIRFKVNLFATKNADLHISSRLLSLALKVEREAK